MSRTTSKRVIADVLEGLSTLNLDKFRFHLRGRRGDPLVTRLDVDDKSVREVADMLVSKFTEAGAVEVTLEMLREINCNEEAARLSECAVGSHVVFTVANWIGKKKNLILTSDT